MHRNTLVMLVIVATGAVALVWWAQRPAPKETGGEWSHAGSNAGKPATSASPSVEARGGEIEQKDHAGKVLWKLKITGTFTTDKNLGTVRGKDVQWDLVKAGGKDWRAVAPEVQVDYSAKRIRFPSGARVAALDGAVSFEAGQVEYQMDNGKLICSGQPTMRLRGSYVRAKEFVVDMQRRLVSARRVRAVYAR